MSYNLSKRSLERLEGIEDVLLYIIRLGITDSPHDFGIPQLGGLRTAEDQNKLYQQGRELPGSIVTNVDGYDKKSYHQTGKAFDIYIYDHETKRASWDKKKLEEVARHLQTIAKDRFNLVLNWGGDWKSFKDYPHFQI